MGRPAIQCQANITYTQRRCPEMKLPGLNYCLRHELALNGAGDDEMISTGDYEASLAEEETYERQTG